MRQVTVTEKYRAVNEGQMAKQEFVRQMRLAFPSLINQFSGYDDSVAALRRHNLLFEVNQADIANQVSDDSIRRALDIEIAVLGHDPVTCDDAEVQAKAKAKAIANLSKDPLHYYNLLAKESSKVDKNDKMKETKRGALEKDTFNDMKKATLKEAKLMTEGTRALVGYLAGNRLTTAYNHYDGYPENLGKGLEAHYNDDEKAKDIAMKGYITYLNPDTGEIEQTHKDAPKKITLPQDEEEFAREIAEEIDAMSADFGYIWDDRSNRWVTIKNTGIRSMIDQIMEKLGDYGEMEEEVVEVDSTLDPYEDRKAILKQVIMLLKTEKAADTDIIKDFIRTHMDDILNAADDQAILDEFDEFVSVNYEAPSDFMEGEVTEGYRKGFDTLIEAIKELNTDGDEVSAAADAMEFIGQHYGIPFEFESIMPSRSDIRENKEMDDIYGDGDVVVDITGMSPGMKAVWEIEKEISQFEDSESAQLVVDNMIEVGSVEHLISYLEDRDRDSESIANMVKAYKSTSVNEKKGKDHDGDGDVDGDDYMSAKDKAIKKAMGKGNVKEAVKNIITKVLEEQVLNEAATNELARIADEYAGFEGLKPAVISLENIVTEIEAFYDKTRDKIQKIYNDLGNITNEEGLKVGAFIAPSIESAFNKDLRPAVKKGFTAGLDTPKVKQISQGDIDRGYVQQEAPKQSVFTPVNEKKK